MGQQDIHDELMPIPDQGRVPACQDSMPRESLPSRENKKSDNDNDYLEGVVDAFDRVILELDEEA